MGDASINHSTAAGALIELNLLSRSLDNGCPLWVDFNGRTYDVDAPTSHGQARTANAKWQRDARDYLLYGDAVLLVRTGSGFTERTLRQLEAGPVLVEADGRVAYSFVHRR